MKAFGYARVSTTKQELSIPAQSEKIRLYCGLNDLDLVEIFAEKESAKDMRSRPEFLHMLDLLRAGRADALVVVKLDRFARNTIEALTLADELSKHGVALHSINEKIDTQSATGRFFYTLLSALAEMERGLISERTATVLRFKKSQGEKTGGGVPYGYVVVDGLLQPDPEEQKVKTLIQSLKAQGMGDGSIATYLNKLGYTAKRGGKWQAVQVQRVLSY